MACKILIGDVFATTNNGRIAAIVVSGEASECDAVEVVFNNFGESVVLTEAVEVKSGFWIANFPFSGDDISCGDQYILAVTCVADTNCREKTRANLRCLEEEDCTPDLIQSNFGLQGNFEVVAKEGARLGHYFRDNDNSNLPWRKTSPFGDNAASAPALIQSNYGKQENFEVVVKEGSKLRHYYRNNDDSNFPWHKASLFGDDAASAPALIQSNYGKQGNFEVVVKEGSKLRHYYRRNDAQGLPWVKGPLFGDNVNSAPALIQSNYGKQGNFEVVVKEGSKLRHYYRRNDDPSLPWRKTSLFGADAASAPALIQSNYGKQGNFEVVVKEGSKLRHYYRRNDAQGLPWVKGPLFGDNVNSAPALIQSNYGKQGNFEVVVKEGPKIRHYYRDNDKGQTWHTGPLF